MEHYLHLFRGKTEVLGLICIVKVVGYLLECGSSNTKAGTGSILQAGIMNFP